MKRRILTDIRLDRIAAVDVPCQEHARAVIMKSSDAGVGLFMSRVTEIRKRDRCSRHRAMSKARIEYPEAFSALQQGRELAPSSARQLAELQKARATFGDLVKAVQDRDHVPRHIAMRNARRANPEAFVAAWG